MKQIIISSDDILDMNIKLASDLLSGANVNPYKEEKLKSLVIAKQIIEKSLIDEGINVNKIKIKKKENKNK